MPPANQHPFSPIFGANSRTMETILDQTGPEPESTPDGKTLSQVLTDGYDFDFANTFGGGWNLWTKDIGQSILYALVVGLILFFSFFTIIGPIFLWLPLTAGYFVAADKLSKGLKPEFRDYFGGFRQYGKTLGLSLIFTLVFLLYLVIIFSVAVDFDMIFNLLDGNFTEREFLNWYFEFIGSMFSASLWGYVVGAFFIAIWIFSVPFVVIGNLGAVQALIASTKVVFKKFGMLLLYAVVLYILEYVGALILYIGLLAAAPLNSFLKYAAYKEIVGTNDKRKEYEEI